MSKLLVSILLASVIAFPACSCGTAAASPLVLARETKQVVQEIKETEQDVFQVLQENLDSVSELKNKLKSTDNPSTMMSEVVVQLEEVANSFREIAHQKESVKNDLLKRLLKLQDLRERAQEEVAKLVDKKAALEQEISNIKGPDQEVVQIKQESMQQAVEYQQRQIEIWEQFVSTQKAIEPQIQVINQRVDKLMAVIEGSALVYREALNLLKLQQDIEEAFGVLTHELPEVERLSNEMKQSWETLDNLVEALLTSAQPAP